MGLADGAMHGGVCHFSNLRSPGNDFHTAWTVVWGCAALCECSDISIDLGLCRK